MKIQEMTHSYLLSLVLYDPATGHFFDRKSGDRIGSIRERRGYKTVVIKLLRNFPYSAHRLAWFYMTGTWPTFKIDHENRDATDNRWVNLRDGSHINVKNMSMSNANTSGVTGVGWDKKKQKWRATGHYKDANGKHRQKFLGYFPEIDAAALEVLEFRLEHGYQPGHGQAKKGRLQ